MAHFAELNELNIVTRVIVVDNDRITDDRGQESEAVGVAFCQSLFGSHTRWVQTSYNASFRKNYAGLGAKYDLARDAFIGPQPYPSWQLDENCRWVPPVAWPTDGEQYQWSELGGGWVLA